MPFESGRGPCIGVEQGGRVRHRLAGHDPGRCAGQNQAGGSMTGKTKTARGSGKLGSLRATGFGHEANCLRIVQRYHRFLHFHHRRRAKHNAVHGSPGTHHQLSEVLACQQSCRIAGRNSRRNEIEIRDRCGVAETLRLKAVGQPIEKPPHRSARRIDQEAFQVVVLEIQNNQQGPQMFTGIGGCEV